MRRELPSRNEAREPCANLSVGDEADEFAGRGSSERNRKGKARSWTGTIACQYAIWRAAGLRRRTARKARADILLLASLDDRTLNDLGIARADIEWALSLPLRLNPAHALRERIWPEDSLTSKPPRPEFDRSEHRENVR